MPIFDQGYQHWKGELSGHVWRWLVIARQGLRGQLKGTISLIRILLVMAFMPAVVLVTVLALWGMFEQGSETVVNLVQPMLPAGIAADPHAYRNAVWTISYSFFFKAEIFFIMLIVVVAGPNLISRDLRFNALPLYFSRPLTRMDYFFGKLGVIAALVGAVAIMPALAAYALGVCFSLDLSVIRDTWRLLPAIFLYALVIVISAGMLMLAISSLSRRSLYVGIAWVGFWVISTAVSGVLEGLYRHTVYSVIMQEEKIAGNLKPGDVSRNSNDRIAPRSRSEAWLKLQQRLEQEMVKAAPTNWRPLCSYTANLQRLGEGLLNTDAAWVQIGRAVEVPRVTLGSLLRGGLAGFGPVQVNNRRLADQLVPQYPWTWSAGVLLGLLGLSIWILTSRVKSLDRLQ